MYLSQLWCTDDQRAIIERKAFGESELNGRRISKGSYSRRLPCPCSVVATEDCICYRGDQIDCAPEAGHGNVAQGHVHGKGRQVAATLTKPRLDVGLELPSRPCHCSHRRRKNVSYPCTRHVEVGTFMTFGQATQAASILRRDGSPCANRAHEINGAVHRSTTKLQLEYRTELAKRGGVCKINTSLGVQCDVHSVCDEDLCSY